MRDEISEQDAARFLEGSGAYPRVLVAFNGTPWAIMPSKLAEIRSILLARCRGERLSADVIAEARRTAPPPRTAGKVAVLPVFGTISQRPSMFSSGGTSTEALGKQLDQAVADRDVRTIILNVDSPGGSVFGVAEVGAKIREARSQKQVIAVANSMAASAAYWIASQAGEIVVTPGGMVGSIGVLTAHEDVSGMEEKAGVRTTLVSAGKYKTEGHPFGPLSDDARDEMQAQVDRYYGMFVDAVAKGRGRRNETVRNGFGQGRMVGAEAAVREGMADRVGTLEQTLARLGTPGGSSGRRSASASVPWSIADRMVSLAELDD